MANVKQVMRRVAVGSAVGGAAEAGLAFGRARQRADLAGQVALVTGGSRGLGLLLARELVRQGCRVVICARDSEALDQARQELTEAGGDVLCVPCDVANRTQAENLVAQTVDHFGRLDIVVNNAGVIQVGPIESAHVSDFEAAMGTMFWGTVHVTLAALPRLRAQGHGRIANITSVGGKISVPHLLPYSCAKFATVAFSEGLHAELRPSGIGVTTVVPGLMRTGSHLHARFHGRSRREFSWFTASASIPPLSMDAERAAERIVDAIRRDRSEVILTPQARAAAVLEGVVPGATSSVMSVVHRLLPGPGPDERPVEGEAVAPRQGLLRRLSALNRRAAHRANQTS